MQGGVYLGYQGYQNEGASQQRFNPTSQPYTDPGLEMILKECDECNAPANFMRASVTRFPSNPALKSKIRCPIGFVFQPLAPAAPGSTDVPVIDYNPVGTIVRCRKCRTYVNPFCQWEVGGRRWMCNMCGYSNETLTAYYGPVDNNTGRRTDRYERPELCCGSVEFLAPDEYTVRRPQNPVYMFLIEVTQAALQSRATDVACEAIKELIVQNKLAGGTRAQIGIMAFDSAVYFFKMSQDQVAGGEGQHKDQANGHGNGQSKGRPKMVTVCDFEDPFVPIYEDVLSYTCEVSESVLSLLSMLPSMFRNKQGEGAVSSPSNRNSIGQPGMPNQASAPNQGATGPQGQAQTQGGSAASGSSNGSGESCFGSAVRMAGLAMKHIGGKLVVCASSIASCGEHALKSTKDNGRLLNTDREIELLRPSVDGYKELAAEMSKVQVSVDLFFATTGYVDLASVSPLCKFTSGELHYYPHFSASAHGERYRAELMHAVSRLQGWEAVMRVRISKGWKISSFFGHLFVRGVDLLVVPNCHADQTFGLVVEPDDGTSGSSSGGSAGGVAGGSTGSALTAGLGSIGSALSSFGGMANVGSSNSGGGNQGSQGGGNSLGGDLTFSIQLALLYTNSYCERRIRVHTMQFACSSNANEVYNSMDPEVVSSLLANLAIESSIKTRLSEGRALVHSTMQQIASAAPGCPHVPSVAMFLMGLLKSPLLRQHVDPSTLSDARMYWWSRFDSMPLSVQVAAMYPRLIALHTLMAPGSDASVGLVGPNGKVNMPADLPLAISSMTPDGIYLAEDGESMNMWVGGSASPNLVKELFGIPSLSGQANKPELNPEILEQVLMRLAYSNQPSGGPQGGLLSNKSFAARVANIINQVRDDRKPFWIPCSVFSADNQLASRVFLFLIEDKNPALQMSFAEFLQRVGYSAQPGPGQQASQPVPGPSIQGGPQGIQGGVQGPGMGQQQQQQMQGPMSAGQSQPQLQQQSFQQGSTGFPQQQQQPQQQARPQGQMAGPGMGLGASALGQGSLGPQLSARQTMPQSGVPGMPGQPQGMPGQPQGMPGQAPRPPMGQPQMPGQNPQPLGQIPQPLGQSSQPLGVNQPRMPGGVPPPAYGFPGAPGGSLPPQVNVTQGQQGQYGAGQAVYSQPGYSQQQQQPQPQQQQASGYPQPGGYPQQPGYPPQAQPGYPQQGPPQGQSGPSYPNQPQPGYPQPSQPGWQRQ